MDNYTTFNKIDNLLDIYIVINIFYLITVIVGFFGNILIVFTILKNKYLRTPMNISLVSLAFCDLTVCACVLPVRMFLYSSAWDASYTLVLCRVDVFLKSVCDYVQPATLVATSLERYKSIAKPFENKGKVKRIVIVVSVTWCTCLCGGIVSAVLFRDGATYFPCSKSYKEVQLYTRLLDYREGYVTLPIGFSCIILVIFFYYLMIRTLYEHSNKMKKRLKAKPFRNKVKPESIKKEINKDRKKNILAIKPAIPENNETTLSDTSRLTTITTDGSKSSPRYMQNLPEQSVNLAQDAIKEELPPAKEENQTGKKADSDQGPRRISIKKTREQIYCPVTETKRMQRLSVVAKHVVLLKAHKKKSLYNMYNKCSKNSAVSNQNGSTSESQISDRSEEIHTDTTVMKVDHSEVDLKNTETSQNQSAKENDTNLTELLKTDAEERRENKQCDGSSLSDVKQANRNEDNLSENKLLTSLKRDTEKGADTDDKMFEESHRTHVELDSHNNNEHVAIKTNDSRCTDEHMADLESQQTCIKSNEVCVIRENNVTNGGNILVDDVSEKTPETATENNEKVQNENNKEKPKVSNVDVVDFDGTVHKDVKVEGAVVGAVCVMNKSNRLEGRRKVEMRAAKRIAVMIGSFALLWLPLPLIALFVSSRRQISSNDIEALLVSASISATTVAFNPVLNLLLNKQLRSAATSVLRRAANAIKRVRLR